MSSNPIDFSAILAKAREQATTTSSNPSTITCKTKPNIKTSVSIQASVPMKVSFTREECVSFIIRMRDAKTNEEKILVLKSFSGYDNSLPLGLQIDNASLMAKATIRRENPKLFKRGVSATLAGYIAGMPDPVSKIRDDLKARIELASHELANAEWVNDKARYARECDNIKRMQKELDNLAG